MPTYDYHCSACKHRWEQLQSIKSDPVRKCPKCKKQTAVREIGTGAAIMMSGHSPEPAAAASGAKAKTDKAAKPAAASTTAGAGASIPAAATPDAAASEPENSGKATHPAREGRGFGNIRDALTRQKREDRKSHGNMMNRGPGAGAFGAAKRPQQRGGGGGKGK